MCFFTSYIFQEGVIRDTKVPCTGSIFRTSEMLSTCYQQTFTKRMRKLTTRTCLIKAAGSHVFPVSITNQAMGNPPLTSKGFRGWRLLLFVPISRLSTKHLNFRPSVGNQDVSNTAMGIIYGMLQLILNTVSSEMKNQ